MPFCLDKILAAHSRRRHTAYRILVHIALLTSSSAKYINVYSTVVYFFSFLRVYLMLVFAKASQEREMGDISWKSFWLIKSVETVRATSSSSTGRHPRVIKRIFLGKMAVGSYRRSWKIKFIAKES